MADLENKTPGTCDSNCSTCGSNCPSRNIGFVFNTGNTSTSLDAFLSVLEQDIGTELCSPACKLALRTAA